MRPRSILFDLDGTLTDPREGIVNSIAHALAAMNRPVPDPEALTRWIGPPLARVFGSLLSTDDPALIRAAIGAYRERFASVGIFENRLQPGISEALNGLEQGGFRLFVVTSKPKLYAMRIVNYFSLRTYFQAIHGPDLEDLDANKSSLIRELIQDHGIDPTGAAMVGDRGDDIEGARVNGLIAVGVAWGFSSLQELEAADQIVHSPAELFDALGAESDGAARKGGR